MGAASSSSGFGFIEAPIMLTKRVFFGYGLGQFGGQICRDVPAGLLLFFMTQNLGLAPALAGAVVLIPKVWVVIGDLLVGVVSDRTTSRWGRRRPYILAGAVASGIGFMAMFLVPGHLTATATALYVGAFYLLMSTGLSLFGVPYLAMASELSADPAERTTVLSYRQVFVFVGVFVGLAGAPIIISALGGGADGYRGMAIVLGGLILAAMATPFVATRGVKLLGSVSKARISADLGAAVRNPTFMILIAANIAQSIAVGGISAASPFYVLQTLGYTFNTLSLFVVVSIVGASLAQPIWVAAAKRFGRPSAYILTLVVQLASLSGYLFLPRGHLIVLNIFGFFGGAASGGFSLMSLSILTDVIEADAAKSGGREALLSSFFTMTEKLAVAIGAFGVAGVLSLGGYLESHGVPVRQTPKALLYVRYAFVGVSGGAIFVTLLLAFLLRYAFARGVRGAEALAAL